MTIFMSFKKTDFSDFASENFSVKRSLPITKSILTNHSSLRKILIFSYGFTDMQRKLNLHGTADINIFKRPRIPPYLKMHIKLIIYLKFIYG